MRLAKCYGPQLVKNSEKQQKKCFEGIKETKKGRKKKRIIPRHKISGQVGKQKNIYTHTNSTSSSQLYYVLLLTWALRIGRPYHKWTNSAIIYSFKGQIIIKKKQKKNSIKKMARLKLHRDLDCSSVHSSSSQTAIIRH